MKIKREYIEVRQAAGQWYASIEAPFPCEGVSYDFNIECWCYGETEAEAIANLQKSFDELIKEVCDES